MKRFIFKLSVLVLLITLILSAGSLNDARSEPPLPPVAIPIPALITDVVVCEDGTVWVAGFGTDDAGYLFQVDLGEQAITKTIELGVLYGPRVEGLDIDVACTKAYVADFASDTVSVIDLETGEMIADIAVAPKPADLALTWPDNTRLVVANPFSDELTIIDPLTYSIMAMVATCFGPERVATKGKAVAYATCRYSDEIAVIDLTVPAMYETIAIEELLPGDMAITPSGTKLYVADLLQEDVIVIDTAMNEPIKRIPLGGLPKSICISRDNRFAYVPRSSDDITHPSDVISVIDTAKDTVVATISVRPEVIGIPIPSSLFLGTCAVTPDNTALLVAAYGMEVEKVETIGQSQLLVIH